MGRGAPSGAARAAATEHAVPPRSSSIAARAWMLSRPQLQHTGHSPTGAGAPPCGSCDRRPGSGRTRCRRRSCPAPQTSRSPPPPACAAPTNRRRQARIAQYSMWALDHDTAVHLGCPRRCCHCAARCRGRALHPSILPRLLTGDACSSEAMAAPRTHSTRPTNLAPGVWAVDHHGPHPQLLGPLKNEALGGVACGRGRAPHLLHVCWVLMPARCGRCRGPCPSARSIARHTACAPSRTCGDEDNHSATQHVPTQPRALHRPAVHTVLPGQEKSKTCKINAGQHSSTRTGWGLGRGAGFRLFVCTRGQAVLQATDCLPF